MSASAFRDSAPDLSDTPLLRERMRHQGYLFVRDLLPADELAVLSMPLLAIARAGDWVQKRRPVHTSRRRPRRFLRRANPRVCERLSPYVRPF